MATDIHVISKQDINKHATISVEIQHPPLAANSVRVQTRMIGITANNFTYASFGSILHWWDAYPVPSAAPAPYNDPAAWGIVPAWGYGEIVESNVDGLEKGASLWGYWPTSSHLVDLQLEAGVPKGHYIETSPHRQKLMNLYNRYMLVEGSPSDEAKAWRATTYPIWAAGYLMNRYTFAESAAKVVPFAEIDPAKHDADLSSAVVIVLAASSKTGRSVVWNLGDRAPGNGPLALLQATSDATQPLPLNRRATFDSKTVSYTDLTSSDTMSWVADRKPSRIIVVDNGGPFGTVQRIHDATQEALGASAGFTFVGVGSQSKAVSMADLQAGMEAGARLGRLQFNASGVQDVGMAQEGNAAFFRDVAATFQRWVEEKAMGDLELSWGRGIAGGEGVEKAWEELATGTPSRTKAQVYRLP